MQITNTSIAGRKVVFESILDEIPGGVSVDVTRLDYTAAGKEYLPAGTPVYVDLSTRVAEVCKSVAGAASGDATHIYVAASAHHFKVGDSITDFVNNRIISAITASGTGYEVITVPSGLKYGSGQVYGEAVTGLASAYYDVSVSANNGIRYTPNGMLRDQVRIKEGNADAAIVKMGTAREDALFFPIPDTYQKALRGGTTAEGTSLITLV